MDNSQEMTTPLNRFFTFWWILAGFAVFGVLALVAYLVSGGSNDDTAYETSMAARLETKGAVDAAQAQKLAEVKLDIQAGIAALSAQSVAASEQAAPGTPTHDKMMEEMAAKMAAEAAASSDASAVKLSLSATNLAKGEPALQYVEKELSVPSGALVELTFKNPDAQPHNVVLCKPGTKDSVVALAMAMVTTDAEGAQEKGYIPESGDIIANSKLLTIGQQEVIKFTAPAEGEYPYVCTFPGHAALMHGVLKVGPAAAGGAEKPAIDPNAQKLTLTATNSAKGEPPLQYVEKELTAKAGQPIALTFKNPDIQQHNVVICKAGTKDAVVKLAAELAADPDGAVEKHYVPESDDIIASSKLITIGQQDVMSFTIAEPGEYPYVCTFPGHGALMFGTLTITPAE